MAAPAPGGSIIFNKATGSFIDTDSSEKPIESNIVQVTVAEIAGVTVTVTGTSGTPNPGQTVYFNYTIKNLGNDPTQFFIPALGTLTGNATQPSNIQITEYSIDGTSLTDLSASPITVPNGGGQTGRNSGGTAGLLKTPNPNGEFQPNGYITVRIPVLINSTGVSTGDIVTAQLGDTPVNSASTATPQARQQNIAYNNINTVTNRVYTVDDADALNVTNEATGFPFNGDTTNHRQEASAIAQLSIIVPSINVSGNVFEDPNYGSGAGRPLSTSGIFLVDGATVELYKSDGSYVSNTTTSGGGKYTFNSVTPGDYYVRVVNSTVKSVRPGTIAGLLPVQTFRVNDSTGTPTDDTARVGGEKPSVADTGAAATGAILNTTNFTFAAGAGSAPAGAQAQSIAPVKVGSSAVTGIDFGYNFDTIVNTNDSGQGSLRQFITNSNALTNTGLAQQGLTAGQETSIFMIPDGVAHPGLRSGLTNQVAGTGSNSGAAVITILSPLDAVTDTNTTLDGSTQSTNVGDTNAGQVGSAPTVGVAGMAVPSVNRPEIVIDGRNLTNSTNADQYAITLNANYSILRGLAVYGGKGNYASSTQGDSGAIRVGSTLGTNVTLSGAAIIEQNLIGTFADGSDPGSTLQNQRYGTICFGACEIKNNFLAFNGYATLLFGSGADGSKITGNEYQFNGPNIAPFTNPGMGSADGDTIGIWSASSILVEGNLIANTRGVGSNTLDGGKGIEIVDTLGHDTINNQIRNNTIDKSSTAGIGLYAGPSGNTIFQNIISNTTPTATSSSTAYVGAGIIISATGADRNSASITVPDRNTISQNSIFRNMGLGIDIDPRDWYMGDGVTANTGATSNIVPNIGMNYPVMSTSSLSGSGTLSVTGYVGKETTAGDGDADFANAKLEFFIADNTPANQDGEVILGDGLSKPHGEGKTYIGTCTTDTKGLFSCSFPNAGTLGLTNARDITATATDSVGNTSEFSSILSSVPSVNHPNVLLVKRITAINGTTASASGQNLAAYNEEPTNAYDDNDLTVTVPPQNPGDPALDTDKWPNTTGSTASTFLIGGINGGNVKSNDEVEYTIYFLSAGPVSAKGVQMCDRIPSHQTFVPDTFNSLTAAPNTTPVLPIGDRGIEVSQGSTAYGYTNIGDGDTARYYPPGSALPSACTQPPLPEDNGAIVVTLGDVLNATAPGTPTESYGFFRFRARVK
jgi:trimeric autotransporter adhesin